MDLSDALSLGGRELVAFVGAGGKKTAMRRLAAEGTEQGYDVGYTTTTQMPPPADLPLTVADVEVSPFVLTEDDPPVAFAAEWVADPERADRKVNGFDPDVLDAFFDRGMFDWLVVKADGARRREFKAPGPGEPALPDRATHVVPVASVTVVGEPLSAEVVHRPERVASITDLAVGDELTPEAVGTVLASPDGGLKGVPPAASVTPMVNKADDPAQRETARGILDTAVRSTDRFDRGLVTSFEADVCDVVDGRPSCQRA